MDNSAFLWPPCVADADIIFCPVISTFMIFVVLIRRR